MTDVFDRARREIRSHANVIIHRGFIRVWLASEFDGFSLRHLAGAGGGPRALLKGLARYEPR